jgi:hypothetical protein
LIDDAGDGGEDDEENEPDQEAFEDAPEERGFLVGRRFHDHS